MRGRDSGGAIYRQVGTDERLQELAGEHQVDVGHVAAEVPRVVRSAPSVRVTVLLDRDIVGFGAADLVGGNNVQFMLLHLTSLGGNITKPEALVDDHLLRAGWIAFGRTLTLIGGVSRDYWHEPVYLNWTDVRWIPDPNINSATVLAIVATRFRWYLSPGTAGHVYIQGP